MRSSITASFMNIPNCACGSTHTLYIVFVRSLLSPIASKQTAPAIGAAFSFSPPKAAFLCVPAPPAPAAPASCCHGWRMPSLAPPVLSLKACAEGRPEGLNAPFLLRITRPMSRAPRICASLLAQGKGVLALNISQSYAQHSAPVPARAFLRPCPARQPARQRPAVTPDCSRPWPRPFFP